jgi:hypothetical protein
MKRTDSYVVLGLSLVGAGVLFLLQTLGLLGAAQNIFWTALFAASGAAFLVVFVRDVARWWALIPGLTLLSLAALVGLNDLAPAFAQQWGGALFLGGIGLSFWLVYLSGRERWWAIIPGGTLLTLASVAALSESNPGMETGGIFFLGLALTFGLVYVLPTPTGHIRWAIYPAGAFLAMAILVIAAMGQVINILWPAALILAGLYLAYRSLRLQHQ